jgi:hypothetical protein
VFPEGEVVRAGEGEAGFDFFGEAPQIAVIEGDGVPDRPGVQGVPRHVQADDVQQFAARQPAEVADDLLGYLDRTAADPHAASGRRRNVVRAPDADAAAFASRLTAAVSAKPQKRATQASLSASLGSVCVALTLTSAPLLMARGRPGIVFNFGCVTAATLAASLLVGTRFGLVGAATAWVIVLAPLRLLILAPCLRELELSMAAYFKTFASPFMATGVMVAAVCLERRAFLWHGHLEAVAMSVAVGAVLYVGGLLLFDRRLGGELFGIARDVFAPARA